MATSHLILLAFVASVPLILVTAQVPSQVAPQPQNPFLILMQKMYSDYNDTAAWYSDLGEMFRLFSQSYTTMATNGSGNATSNSPFDFSELGLNPIVEQIQKIGLGTKFYNLYLTIAKQFQQLIQWFTGRFFGSAVVTPGAPKGRPTARSMNPLSWFNFSLLNSSIIQKIPDTAFGYLNVTTSACKSRAVCETAQYIMTKVPSVLSPSLASPSLGLLSLWSSDPLFQAFVSGALNQNCGLLYSSCSESPFTSIR